MTYIDTILAYNKEFLTDKQYDTLRRYYMSNGQEMDSIVKGIYKSQPLLDIVSINRIIRKIDIISYNIGNDLDYIVDKSWNFRVSIPSHHKMPCSSIEIKNKTFRHNIELVGLSRTLRQPSLSFMKYEIKDENTVKLWSDKPSFNFNFWNIIKSLKFYI